ncbi:MAG TPA: DNA-3-methyladenine glycosylase [Patescibacteria group bacterium]|nr:DNA-3-methyladenine glycosylase [Patescibacteria group bacterium]
MKLKRSFFNRDTNIVAQELLGKKIVRVLPDGSRIEAIITETEAYHGFDDKASHASRGKTERNKVMFDKAGLVYVYLIYGMHYCLNFTTMGKGFPAAVLIRAVALKIPNHKSQCPNKSQTRNSKFKNLDFENYLKITKLKIKNLTQINGPGRTCKALQIDKSLYGEDLVASNHIWIEPVETQIRVSKKIISSKRIGVDYAGECKNWEWNYKVDAKAIILC